MFGFIKSGVNLLNQCSDALNKMRHPQALQLLRDYERITRSYPMPPELTFRFLYFQAELALRTGHYRKALHALELNLASFDRYPDLKFKLLLKAGKLECHSNRLNISPRYFSEALALAESQAKPLMIAEAYGEIAHMFSIRYQGLAIYFHRKAERAYSEAGDSHNLTQQRINRAYLCAITARIKPNLNHKERLEDEAVTIFANTDTSRFNPHEIRHFLHRKGVILRDENIIKRLIDDMAHVEALPDKCLYEECYMGLCIEKGEFAKAKDMATSYFRDARSLHGDSRDIRSRVTDMEKIIAAGVPVPYIPYFIPPNNSRDNTLFDILDHYALQDELWALDKSPIRCMFPYHSQEGLFEPVLMPDGLHHLYPLGLAFNVYYRGQAEHYPVSKPTLYRKGMTEARQFAERLKYIEFRKVVESYPLTKLFRNDFYVVAPDSSRIPLPLAIDSLALAQHYGIKTELMDLTTDKFVAAFFATTDCIDDVYYPITDKREKKGAFYRYSEPPSIILSGKTRNRMRAVGLQPFSRPGEQQGLVYEMRPDDDFNKIAISTDYFNHDPEVSEFIFNYTNRSRKLFPVSPILSHAEAIKKSKTFSYDTLTRVREEFYPELNDETINSYLEEVGINIVESTDFGFSADELMECEETWKNGENDRILSRILPRFTFRGPVTCQERGGAGGCRH